MTPAEIFLLVEAHVERMENHRNELIMQAWLNIYLDRTKRLPKLETLLAVEKPPKTKEELEAEWAELNDKFPKLGGEKNGN